MTEIMSKTAIDALLVIIAMAMMVKGLFKAD